MARNNNKNNNTRPSLLNLPSELRTLISIYTLTHPDPIPLERTFHKGQPFTTHSYLHHQAHPHLLAFTATCRQLHHETRLLFYAVNVFQCNPYPRHISGARFEDVLGVWKKQIGQEKWELAAGGRGEEGEGVVLWHAFSHGYLCGSWTPEVRRVVCGMWDYAVATMDGVEGGLRRVRLELALPKKMGVVGVQVIELGDLVGSWGKVLGEVERHTTDESVDRKWIESVLKQLHEAREYMLNQSVSLDVA